MTVEEESENRGRCIYGLLGVLVAVDGAGEPLAITATRWGDGGVLEVSLPDGAVYPSSRLHLRSPWPVVCCEPRTSNEWNRVRHDPPPEGVRPPH